CSPGPARNPGPEREPAQGGRARGAAQLRPQAMDCAECAVSETGGPGPSGRAGVSASRAGALDGRTRVTPTGPAKPHARRLSPVANRHQALSLHLRKFPSAAPRKVGKDLGQLEGAL